MSKKIYKFVLEESGIVFMPKDTSVLKVALQNGRVCLWGMFLSDNEEDIEERNFIMAPTGVDIELRIKYIETFFDGPLVWHLHEDMQPELSNETI